MKVVSPATSSVLRLVPRSENLKKVPKVSISPLPAYVHDKYSISASQHAARLRQTACVSISAFACARPRLTGYKPSSGLFLFQASQAIERSQRPIMAE